MSTRSFVDPDFDIEKPLLKDGKWLIFPNAIFSHLDTIDCNDSIEGQCYKDKTFDECIKMCEGSSECAYGYYVSNKNTNTNICAPIRDLKINTNPVYRLRKKDIYPELKNSTTRTFINKQKYYFPPVQANNVFYLDNLIIQNTETSTILDTSPISDPDQLNFIKFTPGGNLIVEPIQIPPNLSSEQYIILKYGDKFALNIPHTNLVIKEAGGLDRDLQWDVTTFEILDNISFYLEPLTPGKRKGDDVQYSDIFNIRMDSSILGISNTTFLLEKQKKINNSTFRFIPKMIGFYCNNDSKCTPIPLEQMVINDKGIGTKDGLDIGRNPGCWGVCRYKIKNQPRLKQPDVYKETKPIPMVPLLFFFIFFLFIFLFLYIRVKKKYQTRSDHTKLN